MLFIVILVESPASHWESLNSQKMVCHTGGPHFPGSMGIPGLHFPGSMGTRDPHFGGPHFHMTPEFRTTDQKDGKIRTKICLTGV